MPFAERSHSKVACWGVVFDLFRTSPLLRRHVADGTVAFGINHEMRDFVHDRKKNLDCVLCTPSSAPSSSSTLTLSAMAKDLEIEPTDEERAAFEALPELRRATVGGVLMALEAKAC